MIRYLTAGESHGPELTGILEGVPAGFNISKKYLDSFLKRRQKGVGSGGRMNIEQDEVLITSGVVNGISTGAPIALRILNRDWENWKDKEIEPYVVPRPGHADLVGTAKYNHEDIRFVLERASARETAMRTAIGAIAAEVLEMLGITIVGYVSSIGPITYQQNLKDRIEKNKVTESDVGCPDQDISKLMEEKILLARKNKDTLGGSITCVASGVPPTIGSFVHWDKKLDAILAKQFMSVQSVKAVEIGKGIDIAGQYGTEVQDQYSLDGKKINKISNNLGGFEGGMTNGEDLHITAYLKPISTTLTPINSIDLAKKMETQTVYERSDTCAVPRAIPIFEGVMAFEILNNLLLKTGGDNKKEIIQNFNNISKLETDEFNMKNELWSMKYDV
ncbi:chorismate synthase [Acidimicrobiia bacterium]|nr:chorismate synthase [Acidimicrobiia bacterium]MDA9275844.1 chorismate synthase [Acidimicrobiia bacterium]